MTVNSPAYDVALMLAADTLLGLTLGTELFVHREPASPDATITVSDIAGFDADARSEYEYERPVVNIRVRGARNTGAQAAYETAKSIWDILRLVVDETWGNSTYIALYPVSSIQLLSFDEVDRPVYLLSFRIHRTPSV